MQPIISVSHLSKRYSRGPVLNRTETLREFIHRKVTSPLATLRRRSPGNDRGRNDDFLALDDVNFDVAQGEVVGIIGRNGAGKSTLLKIVSRITDPTCGSITLRGRLASLLEVGTGFHPELTGRENIFMNGAILGMRKREIARKFDEMVAFAEVEQFLDTPVKHYSSGMYVRLAFAVAAHLEPEVLIVDEVLAVGDVAFQRKCLGKMSEVSRGGRTVLFVTHNMAAIENLCQRGVVLEHGKLAFDGPSKQAVRHYLSGLSGMRDNDGHVIDLTRAEIPRTAAVPLLKRLELYTDSDRPLTDGMSIGARLKIRVRFDLPNVTVSFNVGLGFDNVFGQRIFTAHSFFEPNRPPGEYLGPQVFTCEIPSLTLVPGDYTLRVWLDIGNTEADLVDDAARFTVLESDYYRTGKVPWNGTVVMKHHWYLDHAAPEEALSAAAGDPVCLSRGRATVNAIKTSLQGS